TEAAAVLQAGLPTIPDPVATAALAATGRWPILLGLVNGAARADHAAGQDAVQAITQITAALTADGPTALDIADPDRREAAVQAPHRGQPARAAAHPLRPAPRAGPLPRGPRHPPGGARPAVVPPPGLVPPPAPPLRNPAGRPRPGPGLPPGPAAATPARCAP